MKILILRSYDTSGSRARLTADSAWRPDRRPLFVPECSTPPEWELRVAVRISRLGKCISPEFAARYYDAWALVSVQDFGQGDALWADDTMVLGPWQPLNSLPATVDCAGTTLTADIAAKPLSAALSALSQGMTFKTGDVVILPEVLLSGRLQAPSAVRAMSAGTRLLEFNIR